MSGVADWLESWLGRGVSHTWEIKATGAENDACVKCQVKRCEHSFEKQGHHFVEEE